MLGTTLAISENGREDELCDYFRMAEARAELLRPSLGAKLRLSQVIALLVKRDIQADDSRIMLWAAAAVCQNDDQRALFLKGFEDSVPSPASPPTPPLTSTTNNNVISVWAKRRLLFAFFLALIASVSIGLIWWHFLRNVPSVPSPPVPVPPTPEVGYTTRLVEYLERVSKQIELTRPSWLVIAALIASVCYFLWWLWSAIRKRRALKQPGPAPKHGITPHLNSDPFRDFLTSSRSGLRRLLRHDLAEGKAVHAGASIAATIQAGGIPTLQFSSKKQTPEYLLITECESESDHMSLVARLFRQRMIQEQIPVRHFEFFRQPEILYRVDRKKLGSAEQLKNVLTAYPSAKVLLLLESEAIESKRGIPPWLEEILENREVTHLNPRPPSMWNDAEVSITKRGLSSFFLGGDGLSRLGSRFVPRNFNLGLGSWDLINFFNSNRGKLLDHDLPDGVLPKGLVADLADWLDHDSLQWLGVLAIYPAIVPRLTIELGQSVRNQLNQPLMSELRFIELARLPWLRSGWMPYWLRSELVEKLSPETLAQALPVIQAFILKPPAGEDEELAVEDGKNRKARADLVEWLVACPESQLSDRLLIDALKEKPPTRLGRDWQDHLPPSLIKVHRNEKVNQAALMCLLGGIAVGVYNFPTTTQLVDTGGTIERKAQKLEKVPSTSPIDEPATISEPTNVPEVPDTNAGNQAVVSREGTEGSLPANTIQRSTKIPRPVKTLDNSRQSSQFDDPPLDLSSQAGEDLVEDSFGRPDLPPNTFFRETIFFDIDSSKVNPDGIKTLDSVVIEMKARGSEGILVTVRCATDKSRSSQYSVGLSLRMCTSVKVYLVSQGIRDTSIVSEATGRNFTRDDTPVNFARDRKADIYLSEVETSILPIPRGDVRPAIEAIGTKPIEDGLTQRKVYGLERQSEQAYERGDFATAFQLNEESCSLGSYVGCFWNGWLFEVGKGVAADRIKAAQWYNRGCELGHKQSCDASATLVPAPTP